MTQARQPAGAPDGRGGQFASTECPATYRILAALRAPEPTRPLRWGSPEEPIITWDANKVTASCCPGCVYDSPEYAEAVAYWQARDAAQ